MKNVLCYGDSNTYGYDPRNGSRYPKELRWTTILQNNLGKDYEIIVEGLNGRTTAYDRPDGAYKNGSTYLEACLASNKPLDYIIFMLGTNDCNKDLQLSTNDIAKGMEKLLLMTLNMIPLIQQNRPEIILVVPAAIAPNYKTSPFADQLDDESIKKSKELGPLYKELAAKYHTQFLDCTDLQVSPIDSEHLTIDSHQKLADILTDMIKKTDNAL